TSGPPSAGTTICPTRTATRADGLNGPESGLLTGVSCTNLSRARQPQANGTSATAHRAAVRAGWVTGVTPTTGSLARIDRVSQYVAIMANPPREIAAYGLEVSISVCPASGPAHSANAMNATAARKTGLRTSRRVSRMASAGNVARPGEVAGGPNASVEVTTPPPRRPRSAVTRRAA